MRGIYQARQAVVWINIDRDHQIQPQEREVSEVILRQALTTKMRVDKTKTAEAINGDTDALEIRQLDAPIITNYHELNMAASIN